MHDVLQLHPTTSGNLGSNSSADGKYPNQSDGESMGDCDRIGSNKIKKFTLRSILTGDKFQQGPIQFLPTPQMNYFGRTVVGEQ